MKTLQELGCYVQWAPWGAGVQGLLTKQTEAKEVDVELTHHLEGVHGIKAFAHNTREEVLSGMLEWANKFAPQFKDPRR